MVKSRTRLKTTLCVSCSFPAGIQGERCRGCEERMCLVCTRAAKNVGLTLCRACEAEHAADLVARHEAEEDARRVNVKEPI